MHQQSFSKALGQMPQIHILFPNVIPPPPLPTFYPMMHHIEHLVIGYNSMWIEKQH